MFSLARNKGFDLFPPCLQWFWKICFLTETYGFGWGFFLLTFFFLWKCRLWFEAKAGSSSGKKKKKIPDGFVSSTITVVMKRSGRFGSLLSLPKNVIKADRTQWNVLVLTDQHVLLKMFWKFYFRVGERVKTKTTTKHFLSEKGNCTLSFSMHCFLKVM